MIELKTPTLELLPQYVDALKRDWTPDHLGGRAVAEEQLAAIAQDAAGFVTRQTNLAPHGDPVTLPDGSQAARIPGRQFWIWDGEFCGRLSIRWQPGTAALPPHVLGHVGYAVVPWKRRQGHATQAVRQVLPYARAQGLPYVEITTDPDNIASQKVITANGGVLMEFFTKPAAFGSARGVRYRIALA
jgi:predicted acetyltransferase